jgi:hypothetical protein
VFLLLFLDEIKNEKQNENEKDNEWECVRDSSGKPGAVGNREDLERIARPEGARPRKKYIYSLK